MRKSTSSRLERLLRRRVCTAKMNLHHVPGGSQGHPWTYEIHQDMEASHKQACLNLEKATQFITQALQQEVGKNKELWVLIRCLEEKEAETGRSLTEQVESNQHLRLTIDELQKHLEAKENSLTQANQTVAFLKKELRDLHQKIQTQQSTHRMCQEVDECLQRRESQLKDENLQLLSDSQGEPASPDALLGPQVSGIKGEEEEDDDEADDGCREHIQSVTGSRTEYTISSEVDMKTELIQEEEETSNMAPILSSETDLSLTGSVSLGQLREVSVVLLDCSGTGGQRGTIDETERDEQPEAWPWSSSTPSTSPSGSPTASCVQQDSVSSISLTERQDGQEKPKRFACSVCGKTFTRRFTLVEHQRIHTGERPHRCATCGRSFTAYRNLRTHRRLHTGERPYSCSLCGKDFVRRSQLQDHMCLYLGRGGTGALGNDVEGTSPTGNVSSGLEHRQSWHLPSVYAP